VGREEDERVELSESRRADDVDSPEGVTAWFNERVCSERRSPDGDTLREREGREGKEGGGGGWGRGGGKGKSELEPSRPVHRADLCSAAD